MLCLLREKMASLCLRHYLNRSHIFLRSIKYLMNAQKNSCFSTLGKTSFKYDTPVKFTTSKAAKVSIEETIGMRKIVRKDAPKYENSVIVATFVLFLLYFCVLREENDIDEILKGNFQNVNNTSAELLDLQIKLMYCKKNNLPTDAIKARIAEIEKINQIKSSLTK